MRSRYLSTMKVLVCSFLICIFTKIVDADSQLWENYCCKEDYWQQLDDPPEAACDFNQFNMCMPIGGACSGTVHEETHDAECEPEPDINCNRIKIEVPYNVYNRICIANGGLCYCDYMWTGQGTWLVWDCTENCPEE
ncbi:MAG: hypothetical protein AB7O62_06670 [Pirellulales bacterium]